MSWMLINLAAVPPGCLKDGCAEPGVFLFAEEQEDGQIRTGMVCSVHHDEFLSSMRASSDSFFMHDAVRQEHA